MNFLERLLTGVDEVWVTADGKTVACCQNDDLLIEPPTVERTGPAAVVVRESMCEANASTDQPQVGLSTCAISGATS